MEICSEIPGQYELISFHVINKPALSKKQFSEIFFAWFKVCHLKSHSIDKESYKCSKI